MTFIKYSSFISSVGLALFSPPTIANTVEGKSVSLAPVLLQVGGTLLFVVALIIAAAWLSKRFNIRGLHGQKLMKVSSVLPLGQKEKLVIVEVEGSRLLLGVTPNGINLVEHLAPVVDANESYVSPSLSKKHVSTDQNFQDVLIDAEKNSMPSSSLRKPASDGSTTEALRTTSPAIDFSRYLKSVLSGKNIL